MSYLQKAKTLPSYGIGVKPDHIVDCPSCRKNKAQIFFNNNPMAKINQVYPCKECYIKEEKLNKETEKKRWYEKQARGIFKHTKTGEKKVLDQRGNEVNNPYTDSKANEFGWMQSGHRSERQLHLEKEGKM